MKRTFVSMATIAALLMVAGNGRAAEKLTLKLTAASHELVPAPVTVPVDAKFAKRGRLVDLATGEAFATQPDALDGKPAITWMAPALAKGSFRNFDFTIDEAESDGPEKVSIVEKEHGLDVEIDGEFFTSYQVRLGPKPYCWPMIGPTGTPITRAYPMRSDIAGEPHDHPHHRSLWFTFDRVNENDFWSESEKAGKTVHVEFDGIVRGPVYGEFQDRVDWIAKSGKRICEDVRRYRFYRMPGARLIDFEIALKASEGDLTFGDSKEGLFGFRVAGTMQVDQGKGKPKGGTIVNGVGHRDGDAWGKRAPWCDYYGPLEGKTVGIAMFDHPRNLRHPTYWHVRTYGLFTANPFGISHFTGDKNQDGTYKLESGKTLNLKYRIYMHSGDTESARVADAYAAYATPPTVSVEVR